MDALSLTELLSTVRAAIESVFLGPCWVVAEISEGRVGPKGHYYMELVEKQADSRSILAKARANIWSSRYRPISEKFLAATGEPIRPGMKILLLVTVEFHEVYGFALNVLDVDPAYTLGELALARKRVIERLTKEGLIERNRRLTLPVAGYRIAVVSSSAAAGYGDFKHHLETNPWQYRFECTLFPALVQGDSAAESIARAFAAAGVHAGNFDYVVLLRGGGSQIDMACFDDYGVAVAIANCPLPVITGIGHERDESVADMVAALHMKTPTAVADYLVGELREFEDRLVAAWQRLAALSSIALKHAAERLDSVNSALARSAAGALTRNSSQIDQLALRAETAAKSQIERAEARLAQLEQALRLLSPESVLRRGYSIVRRNGRSVRQYSDVSLGDELNIRLYDGMLTAIVEGIEQNGGA